MVSQNLEPTQQLLLVKEALESSGYKTYLSKFKNDRPDLIVYCPTAGFVAVELRKEKEEELEELRECGIRLANKTRMLGISITELSKVRIHQVVLDPNCERPTIIGAATSVVNPNEPSQLVFDDTLQENKVELDVVNRVLLRLEPAFTFQGVVRVPQMDEGARERTLLRLALDEQQIEIATREVSEVLKIDGPPGSGKTLVLIARARWFANAHPDWKIQFVSFNKTLAGNLWSQFGENENISVQTFYEFCEERGHKKPNIEDDNQYFSSMSKNVQCNIDALFIDEYQDFHVGWLEYCLNTVKPGRGGTTVAGDSRQALYTFEPPDEALERREVEHLSLTLPYRSTRQILKLASQIDPEFTTTGIDRAPEGPPPNLVYAGSLDDQAGYIAWEISKMIKNGYRKPMEIAVIATMWRALQKLSEQLAAYGIRSTQVGGREGVDAPQWGTVTLTTVHSAKGYEFDVVFLMAMEALPLKDGNPAATIQRRGAYVGPTRARDELFITYTRRNDIIDKLHDGPSDLVNAWTWPDDFEVSK
jgi:hypothetical protein